MRWKKITNFVPAIFFSAGYIIVTIFTLMGTSHPPRVGEVATTHVFTPYPLLSLLYLVVALLISWGIYFSFRDRTGLIPFLISMLGGIAMIVAGIILWVVTATY